MYPSHLRPELEPEEDSCNATTSSPGLKFRSRYAGSATTGIDIVVCALQTAEHPRTSDPGRLKTPHSDSFEDTLPVIQVMFVSTLCDEQLCKHAGAAMSSSATTRSCSPQSEARWRQARS